MLLKKAIELREYLIETCKGDERAIEKVEEFYEHWMSQYSISQEGAQKLHSILDNIYEGVISINEVGTISSCNIAAENIFGYTSLEVIGQNVKMLMPEPYHSEHDGYLANFKRTRDPKIIGKGREVVGQRKDGTHFPLFLAVTQIENEDDPLFVGVVRDLSEQKRLERMKSEFISTVSHELRTPLTSIQGALSLIQSGTMGDVDKKIEPLINIAFNNSERLILLINDMLDLEKIESGKMEFDIEEYDFISLVQDAVKMNEGYTQKHNVTLKFTSILENIKVNIDKNRLHQIMSNLLSNAIKFSPENGIVKVNVSLENKKVKVEIEDNGPGMDEEFQKVIFQKFAQADSSNTKQKGGTGLGLNITKAMIENMNGEIGFVSKENEGTTFYFKFPVVEYNEEGFIKNTYENTNGKILIVEDDIEIANLIGLMLKQENISFDIAYNAQSAKKLLLEDTYDVITLDICLPDKDGFVLLDEIRKDSSFHSLPVIVVSAKTFRKKEEKELTLAFEVVDWINKPINQEQLIFSLHQALNINKEKFPSILHVEDDKDICTLTKILLEDIARIDYAVSKKKAMQKLKEKDYNLLLLDMMLADGSAEELLPMIKEKYPSLPIILFTAQEVDKQLRQHVEFALIKSRTSNKVFLNTITNILNKKEN